LISPFDDARNFVANLKYLCAQYESVSGICRGMKINRQQFNKYLTGQSYPSLKNLRRITDFFGVDEYEILLPHEEFVRRIAPHRHEADTGQLLSRLFEQLSLPGREASDALRRYCGDYAVYFCTPVWSNHLVRSLTRIYQVEQNTYTKNIERLTVEGERGTSSVVQKFHGVATYLVDRINILEYEVNSRELVTHTVLYPSHRRQMRYLTGILLTISSGGNRQPFASRVVYEYLGPGVNLREELRSCRLYPLDSEQVPADVRRRIGNIADLSNDVLLAQAF